MADAPTNGKLVSTVTQILWQPGLAGINFQLGGLMVAGSQFGRVAEAVGSGRIKCWTAEQFGSQGADELAPGMTVNARYEVKPNAMVFSSDSFGTGPGEDRTIVHEAVHAAFDLDAPVGAKTKTQTLSADDEAAAVLAVAFYIRLCSKPVGGFLMEADGPERPALALVDRLGVKPGGPLRPRPYVLNIQDTQPIRTAVAAKWRFTTFIDSDGRFTDNTGAKYTYDGVPVCPKAGCK